jgi:prepilin-type N-terminal cleavage/methylation domain-containing protein
MLGMVRRRMQRGDTLIEVLFAVTIFSAVAVGGLGIMNRGTLTAQRSLEVTLVRQQIDAQAESLRFIHDSYVAVYPNPVTGQASAEWPKIVTTSVAQASTFGQCNPPNGSFVVNSKTARLEPAAKLTNVVSTFSQLRFASTSPATVPLTTTNVLVAAEGIWVEAVRSDVIPGEASGTIDFHIRACWSSPGQDNMVTLGTIVRLYEPRT